MINEAHELAWSDDEIPNGSELNFFMTRLMIESHQFSYRHHESLFKQFRINEIKSCFYMTMLCVGVTLTRQDETPCMHSTLAL